MDSPTSFRRDASLANGNALIWAVGNGLVSTTLVIYLALELGARGIEISLIAAMPRFAGALRLWTPSMIAWWRNRKVFCLGAYGLSGVALIALPALANPARWGSPQSGVAALVVCWCVYHLLEYCGTIALWSWLGDIMPVRIRGRLIGIRERWLTLGQVFGIGASFGLAVLWKMVAPESPRWVPLAWSAGIGAIFLLLAIVPLVMIASCQTFPSALPHSPWRELRRCMSDPAYSRLLVWSVCLAIANGLTGAAQALYPQRMLGMHYTEVLLLRAGMRGGQSALAPAAGAWVDRHGSRRVMLVSQLIVSTGPAFFLLASPLTPWWIGGAYLVWISYGAMNVALDTLKLAIAPRRNNAPALAAYHAVSDLGNGVTLIFGGWLFDRLYEGGTQAEPLYAGLFFCGCLARFGVAALASRLRDQSDLR